MLYDQLKRLKSGSDIRGIAVEGQSHVTLTDEAIHDITRAFGIWLRYKVGKARVRIAVGNDSRISGPHIKEIVTDTLLGSGVDVLYTGLSSTPSMFQLLQDGSMGCEGAIMITASHLPYDRNGLKFFIKEGGLEFTEIDDIVRLASEDFEHPSFPAPLNEGMYDEGSFMDQYSAMLVKSVEDSCGKEPLKGSRIIVDAGNGAGGFFVEKVLKPLGADTEGSMYLDPDGMFPNHVPNPEDKKAIDGLSKQVVAVGADLGIIFDTDVDRSACVDKSGMEINRNALIALLSVILLKNRPGAIVTDSVTSTHLTEFIEAHGGTHVRYKRGYRNVIDKCKELNAAGTYSPLAIETSGHAAFMDNYFLDDGAYVITRILICKSQMNKLGLHLADLIKDLKKPAEEDEVRIAFVPECVNFRTEGQRIIQDLMSRGLEGGVQEEVNYEGVRYNFGEGIDGWLLIRNSVHDPVMPINFESDLKGGNKKMARVLLDALRAYDTLDLAKLEEFAGSEDESV
ncbi:MAG: phosphomannomutase/phosphoglucomutase [Clostridia bacterium]|nr:phosphomannomutase/phosphoglucomutase [Clostridia bacterium]